MAALVPVEYVAYICLWCCTKLRECVFLYQPFHSFSPFPLRRLPATCVLTLSVTLRIHNVRICSILKPIVDCIHSSHPYPHTHTSTHTPYAVHTQRSPSLDFIRDFFIMAARCAHKSQVPRWSKKIHNRLIKGEAARKERKSQVSSDEGNNSCTASQRRDDR